MLFLFFLQDLLLEIFLRFLLPEKFSRTKLFFLQEFLSESIPSPVPRKTFSRKIFFRFMQDFLPKKISTLPSGFSHVKLLFY